MNEATSTTWKDRVQMEIAELQSKIDALDFFVTSEPFYTLDLVTQTLLQTQLHIMHSYCDLLCARIRHDGGL